MNKRIRDGEIMEDFVETGGWMLMQKILQEAVNENKERLYNMTFTAKSEEDLNTLKGLASTIKAYEYVLNLPNEIISLKNRELEGERKNGRK